MFGWYDEFRYEGAKIWQQWSPSSPGDKAHSIGFFSSDREHPGGSRMADSLNIVINLGVRINEICLHIHRYEVEQLVNRGAAQEQW